jgi:dihydroflavonol-4-reductase
VRSFLLGPVPAYADGGLNVVDVRDVATGHLLADEHGTVGERYILGGRNFTFDRLFADLGRISGVETPLKVPRRVAAGAASVLRIGPGRTTLSPQEILAASSSGPTGPPRPSATWAGRRARTRTRSRPR